MDEAFAWADEPGDPSPAQLVDGSFVVWPENWETVCFFWSVRRCWRWRASVGGPMRVMGLDWPQVLAKMQLKRFGNRRMKREEARVSLMEEAIMEKFS